MKIKDSSNQLIFTENEDNEESIHFGHQISTQWTMDNIHIHNRYELNLSLTEGHKFFINDRIYHAQKGDLFFFSNLDLHRNMVPLDVTYERFLIFFDSAVLDNIIEDMPSLLDMFHGDGRQLKNKLSLSKDELVSLRQFLVDTIYELKRLSQNQFMFKKIKLIELLLKLHNIYKKRLLLNEITTFSQTNDRLIPIIDFLSNHYTESFTIDDIAKNFYINKSYLCKLFKEETGFTINDYISGKRILLAKKLLKSGLSVMEASEQVGYNSDTHFIRMFKKFIGLTPKQYAKEG